MTDKTLPKGVYFKHGAYYLVFKNKWHRLGSFIDKNEIDKIRGSNNYSVLAEYLSNKIPSIRAGAKKRGLTFDISAQDLVNMGNKQQWRCAMTNIPMDVKKTEGMRILPYAPSVDRIDNNDGYTKINIRIVCASINLARSNMPDDVFLHLIVSAGVTLSRHLAKP